MLFRYKGINTKGRYKRGFVEAKDNVEAIKKLKTEENLIIIIDLKTQSKSSIIKIPMEIIGKQIEVIENNLAENKRKKEEKKLEKARKKKEMILKKEGFFSKISSLSFSSFRRNKKVEIDEEMYKDLIKVFSKEGIAKELGDMSHDLEIKLKDEEKKPKLRTGIIEKKEKKEEKRINWELIEKESDDPVVKKNKRLRVKEGEIILFTRRLQIMLSSGMSLINSLMTLKKTKNKTMNYIISNIIDDLQSGSTFSEALSKFPNQFDYTYIALVSIGETSGTLDTVLLDIIEAKEQKQKINRKIKTASIYPAIIGIVLVVILILGAVFFIPTFEEMFADQGVPLPTITKIVFKLASIFPYIIGGIIGVIALANLLRKTNNQIDKVYRKYKDKLKLNFKPIKGIVITSYMYNFSFTVSLMIKNGIRLEDALTLSQKTIDNIYIKSEIADISSLVIQGLTFSEAMEQQEHFDEILTNIVLTGEESGQMSFSLNQIAKFYQDELNKKIERMVELVQPISILLMAVFIIPVVFAIYLPILDISSGALLDL